jgi:SAM-dependent methyltransferase
MDRTDPRWASQASYDVSFLRLYDVTTLKLANRVVWGCPTPVMLDAYNRLQGARHLDVGPASGYYLANSGVRSERLVLLDLNANVLAYCGRRLADLRPELVEGDASRGDAALAGSFDSIGLNFVLHCIPLPAGEKFRAVFGHLAKALTPGGVLFGSTILGVSPTRRGQKLQRLYNSKGIFNNADDRQESVVAALTGLELQVVELDRRGSVLRFAARSAAPLPSPTRPRRRPLRA